MATLPIIKPCVGCGYCCKTAVCAYGMYIHRNLTPFARCPSLTWDIHNERYFCKLAVGDSPEAKKAREILGIGEGCSSTLFNEDRDAMIRRQHNRKVR